MVYFVGGIWMELWIIEVIGVKIIYVKWFLLYGLFVKWKVIII